MKHTGGFETRMESCPRYSLPQTIINLMLDGWEVVCILPGPQPQPQATLAPGNHFGGTNYVDPITGAILPTVVFYPQYESNFEVQLIKFLPEPIEPEPIEPCVRCSYPYPNPDRLDREV